MPSRYRDRSERREPDKTPLIDVIFLLLIFFFVTLVNVDLTKVQPTRQAQATQEKVDLLAMSNPEETAPDTLNQLVLLQIQPVGDFEEEFLEHLNKVIVKINAWSAKNDPKHPEIKKDDFLIFVLDDEYTDVQAIQSKVEDAAKKEQLEGNIKELSRRLPIRLPAKNANDSNFESDYINAIDFLGKRIGAYFGPGQPGRQIHIRMHRRVYVKLIDDLFKLCDKWKINERKITDLKFRVINRST